MADRIGKPVSQRQLRVGEMIKQSLSMIFIKNEAKVPNLETNMITVTEVKMSQDLKIAKAYVMPLGGKDADEVINKLKDYFLSNLKKNKFLRKELLQPTKIYVNEILNLSKKNLVNGCANITGGGIADNVKRIIPKGLCAEIDLSNIKVNKVFKWLKKQNISENEMLKTFNCGVGFCIIINPKNLNKINKYFSRKFKPYLIGQITQKKTKVRLNGKVNWS